MLDRVVLGVARRRAGKYQHIQIVFCKEILGINTVERTVPTTLIGMIIG
jgi:hypothetical protein